MAALTFDDGPHPVFTPQVLDILDQYHVKATFFMIGRQMAKYPSLVRKVKAHGHTVGNHTFTHPPDIGTCDQRTVIEELDRCEEEIRDLTGENSLLFRPPCGRIDGATFAVAEDRGYHVVEWTVSADNRNAVTPEAMAARVLRRLRPGMIILLHDGVAPSRAKDVQATELIIRGLQQHGYRMVTVPELLALPGGPFAHRHSASGASAVCAAAVM